MKITPQSHPNIHAAFVCVELDQGAPYPLDGVEYEIPAEWTPYLDRCESQIAKIPGPRPPDCDLDSDFEKFCCGEETEMDTVVDKYDAGLANGLLVAWFGGFDPADGPEAYDL